MSVKTYHDVLDAGCREIRVGVIPAALDRVSVGDMERSRFGAVRALFFIGVNDGNVPPAGTAGRPSVRDGPGGAETLCVPHTDETGEQPDRSVLFLSDCDKAVGRAVYFLFHER